MRCIKPNNRKKSDEFDDSFVLEQLKCSSVISYVEFMRFGYPTHIPIDKLNESFRMYMPEFGYTPVSDDKRFYKILAHTLGFTSQEFKFGNNSICFRVKKSNSIEQLPNLSFNMIHEITRKMKSFLSAASKWQILTERVLLHKRL